MLHLLLRSTLQRFFFIISCSFFFIFSIVSRCSFIENHKVPKECKKQADALFKSAHIRNAFLNRNIPLLQALGFKLYSTWKNGHSIVAEHPLLQGWIIKGDKCSIYGGRNIARLIYAEHLKTLISKYNLNSLKVVEEYLYHIPKRKKKLSDANYLVLSKKIPLRPFAKIQENPHIYIQLKKLIKKGGYWDAQAPNIIPTYDDKGNISATLIDTEPFPSYPSWWWKITRPLMARIGIRTLRQTCKKHNILFNKTIS